MRKAEFVFIDMPLTNCLVRLCQKYYVQIQFRPACQNIENRDTVGRNDLRKDHKPRAHYRHSTLRSLRSMIIRTRCGVARWTGTPIAFSHLLASVTVERYQSTKFRNPCSIKVLGD